MPRSRSRSRSRDPRRERNHGDDRDNSRHHRSHSGNRSKDKRRDISTSRERSRERERRRRKMQADCIRRAGGFQKLADSEGKEPVRLFWDGFQWVAKTGQSNPLQSDPALMNSTRKLRRLYFGNLPLHLGLTESLFQDMLWIEMKNRGLCNNANEQPVLCVWFAKDKGNYGFVEFASVEETNRALEHLDGMNCMGVALKVSRPNDYVGVPVGPGGIPTSMLFQSGAAAAATPAPAVTSRVVRFPLMIKESDLDEGDTWTDFLDDVKQGCQNHGTITSAVVITPDQKDDSPFDVGDVFLEFGTSAEAAACITGMNGRRYLERPVSSTSIEEAVYSQLIKPLAAN